MSTTIEAIHASFKPAAARSAVSWTLEGTTLSREGRRVLDLGDVVSGSQHSMFTRKTGHGKHLKLKTTDGTEAKLMYGSLGPNEGMRQYKTIAAHIAVRLAQTSPDAKIHVGGGMANTIVWFVFGVFFALMGLACIGAGIVSGEAAGVAIGGLIGIAFAGMGSWFAWAFRPFDQERFKVSADIFAAAILQGELEL